MPIPLIPNVTLLCDRLTGIVIRFKQAFKNEGHYYWYGTIIDAAGSSMPLGCPYSGKRDRWTEVER